MYILYHIKDCCSVAKLCLIFFDLHGLQHTRLPCPSLSPSLHKFMSIELVMPSNHFILCRPLLLLPLIFPIIRVFSNVSCLRQVAKVMELQHLTFQWESKGWFPLGLTVLISLQSKGLSRVFFSITIQKCQFFGTQPSLWCSNSHIHIWFYWKNHSFD